MLLFFLFFFTSIIDDTAFLVLNTDPIITITLCFSIFVVYLVIYLFICFMFFCHRVMIWRES